MNVVRPLGSALVACCFSRSSVTKVGPFGAARPVLSLQERVILLSRISESRGRRDQYENPYVHIIVDCTTHISKRGNAAGAKRLNIQCRIQSNIIEKRATVGIRSFRRFSKGSRRSCRLSFLSSPGCVVVVVVLGFPLERKSQRRRERIRFHRFQ